MEILQNFVAFSEYKNFNSVNQGMPVSVSFQFQEGTVIGLVKFVKNMWVSKIMHD